MSHGTKPGMRAPSSKVGRNKRKCEKYALLGRKEKNAERKAAKHREILYRAEAARWNRLNGDVLR